MFPEVCYVFFRNQVGARLSNLFCPAGSGGLDPPTFTEFGRPPLNDRFFSYFTIQSNLIAVVVWLWAAIKPENNSLSRDLARGAAVLYLAVTGIVFALLLSGVPLVTVPFANTVLHKLMPVVLAVDWILIPPVEGVTFRKAISYWMIYPLVWLVYTAIRGALLGWYPYPFLNPDMVGGYGNVLMIVAVILFGAILLIWLIVWIGQKVQRWRASKS